MRLTAFLLTACCISVSAGSLSQSNITYSGKDVKLETVFQAVKRQTGYLFFYDNAIVAKAKLVTVDAKNLPLEEFMELILRGQELTWLLENTTILIQKKKEESKKKDPEQINPVKGTVRGPDGQPVANVNVVIKGTTKGTITNSDGTFSIDANPGDIIIFSSVGFGSKEIKILNTEPIYLALEKNSSILDEVQIIAYGQTSKRFSTGNVSTVKAEEIEKQPVSNPLLALQGRVPGLFITQTTGLPGSGVTVRIQGLNSIGRGNDPLYVIDGVPYTSQLLSNQHFFLGGSGNPGSTGSPFSFINPADIESIDVLKDADATAIYGSRAANGAILITTKKGKIGKPKVDVNLKYGWGKVGKKMDLMNTQEYLQMRREAISNDGLTISTTDYDLNGLWDTTRYTDWQKELIGGTAKYTNISAGISGGTNTAQYLISGTYFKQTNVFPGDFQDQKGSLHFNINNYYSGQKFKFQFTGNYLVDQNELPMSDLTVNAMITAPNAPSPHNSDGSINWMPDANGSSTWNNPLADLLIRYKNNTSNLVGNLNLSYQVLPGLEIKSGFGYTNLQVNEISTIPLIAIKPEDRRSNLSRAAAYGNSSIRSWIIEPQISYQYSFAKNDLEALIGTSLQQNNSTGQRLAGSGYNSDLVLEDIRSATDIIVESSLSSTYKYNALFARLNYNREDKYILNLTVRRDGSSRFGSENLFQNFGSVAAAWIFSSERFFKKLFPFLSFGKLKASYGTTGNEQIREYQFMNLYSAPTGIGVAYQGSSGLVPDGLPNPYIQWELTKKLLFGLSLGTINNNILVEVNYFHNRSSNQLLPFTLPVITGFTGITMNFPATVQNSGWEVSLNTTNFSSSRFRWATHFNLTIPKNELIAFPDLVSSNYKDALVIGKSISVSRLYHFLGVDPVTGVNQFQDAKGNISTNPSSPTDQIVFINTLPKFYGGFQNSFNYKGFELDIFFEYVDQIGSNYYLGHGFGSKFNINQPTSYFDRWQQPGDITSMQRYNSTFSLFQQRVAALTSDLIYSDASYIRLKNLSLSWQVPEHWRKKIHLENARLYLQGQNLLTFTNYYGLDPETKTTTGLPPLRVVTIGMQLGL